MKSFEIRKLQKGSWVFWPISSLGSLWFKIIDVVNSVISCLF